MRVLHVHKITGIGGSERHLLTLLPALRERGVDARFLGLDVAGTDAPSFYRELESAGVPARHVRCEGDVSIRLARDVVSAVRAESADLLHTHLVHADVYGAAAARRLGVPLVSTRHNDDRYLLGPFRHVDRAVATGASRLIAISHAVRRFLVEAGHTAARIETIHYGLDRVPGPRSEPTPAQAGVPVVAPLLLAVGRFVPQKDHGTLLEAFARIRRERPDARLALLGSGPLEAEIAATAARLGLDGAVHLPGRIAPRDWLERADVFVHTSRWEGFGMVLLEAMLASLPVVATRASAVPEVVADGETGLLVEPGDADGLARSVAGLLDDPERARALGEAGLARSSRLFSVATMTERTLALYESVLSGRA
jgi:glycosyltransferase involved in cell wall biosynthesis